LALLIVLVRTLLAALLSALLATLLSRALTLAALIVRHNDNPCVLQPFVWVSPARIACSSAKKISLSANTYHSLKLPNEYCE